MRITFFILFWVIAIFHACLSPFIFYLALWTKNLGIWFLLPIAFLPLILLISYHRRKLWNGFHRGLSMIAIIPAIYISTYQFQLAYAPNNAWLGPLILCYIMIIIGALIIKSKEFELEETT